MSPLETERGVTAWFANNKIAANLLMAFILLVGWKVATTLESETFPTIDPGLVTVSVSYPGATPAEVEDAITRRVEEAVRSIDGVDRVRSTAVENSGTVSLELKSFVDKYKIRDDVQTAVDQLSQFPPANADRARVVVAELTTNVLLLVISGPVDEAGLRKAAEKIQGDLLNLPEIGLVLLQGARNYEVAIEVPEEALRQYGLSLQDVANAVNRNSLNLSAGVLRTDAGEILLRTDDERKLGAGFEDIVITSDETGQRVLLRDIANVVDGFEDADLLNLYNGKPALFLQVLKGDGQDAFTVADTVKEYLRGYSPPPGIEIGIARDDTAIIKDRLDLLIRNGVLGLALVFVFLSLTLDLKLAFWTSLGIPISFLGGFLIFGQFLTLNMVTLFALIVVLGIVVDDAIVVGENIYEEQQNGKRGVHASLAGMRGVFAPVLVGVLTTMAAFLPLAFSTGDLGQILFSIPIVVISVLLISLVEAFLILPAHLSHEGEWSVGAMRTLKLRFQRGLDRFRDRVLLPVIDLAAHFRYITLFSAFAILIVALGLVTSGTLRFVFFPPIEGDQISVELEMPDGTPYVRTERAMQRIVDAGYQAVGGAEAEVLKNFLVTVGGALSGGLGPGQGAGGTTIASNRGQATMELVSASRRNESALDIERRWRDLVGDIPGAESLSFDATTISGGDDVSLDLSHSDGELLDQIVEEIMATLEGVAGVNEIASSADIGKRQLEFELTQAGIAAGLTTQDLSQQIRQAFFGEEVQRIQREREEIRVYVRYPKSQRESLTDLSRVRIRLPSGEDAPLDVVADWIESRSYASIDRIDGLRIVTVSADVDEAFTTPNEVNTLLRDQVMPDISARYPSLRYSFEGQAREQEEDLTSLANNFAVAMLLMYVLLASVLKSYIQPVVILIAVPFGAVGAFIGHLIMGFDLSFLSLFGLVALAGVVVNDSVVLIDLYNRLKSEGYSTHDACVLASRRRFRPILLTTLTTFLGLLPMMLETSLQAQFLIPMAISLAFGILFGSLVILLLVPALLFILEDSRGLKTGISGFAKRYISAR